uniref:Acrosin-binding protein n=1 Tax=Serinus canaria TaxID=9135 RepID=A0A8C9U3K8_SERCA
TLQTFVGFLPHLLNPNGTVPPHGQAQEPGTPLSDQEYHQFFQFLRITVQARTACQLRELYGCKNSLIQRLDEYENHGVIPSGKANHDSQGQAFGQQCCMVLITRRGNTQDLGRRRGGERWVAILK